MSGDWRFTGKDMGLWDSRPVGMTEAACREAIATTEQEMRAIVAAGGHVSLVEDENGHVIDLNDEADVYGAHMGFFKGEW